MSQTKAQLLGPVIGSVSGDITTTGDVSADNVSASGNVSSTGTLTASDLFINQSYPTETPSLQLDFSRTKQLDSRFTFTRNSLATYVDVDGYVRTATLDTPRFDHDPITKECLGLLLEAAGTNYITDSRNWSDTWDSGQSSGDLNLIDMTTTANATTAPDGTNTAANLVISATSGRTTHLISDAPGNTKNTPFTFSCFLKSNTSTTAQVVILNNTNDGVSNMYGYRSFIDVNLSAGTISAVTNQSDDNSQDTPSGSATIKAYPNGWYRVSVSFTTFNGSDTLVSTLAEIKPNNGNSSGSIYAWGAQLEDFDFATSYIESPGYSATREADSAVMPSSEFLKIYNITEGTFNSKISINGYAPLKYTYPVAINALDTDDGTNHFWKSSVFSSALGKVFAEIRNQTTTGVQGTTQQTLAVNTFTKICTSAKDGVGLFTSHDGATTVSNTNADLSASIDSLSLGLYGFCGHISYLTYYNKRLNNTQIELLSS